MQTDSRQTYRNTMTTKQALLQISHRVRQMYRINEKYCICKIQNAVRNKHVDLKRYFRGVNLWKRQEILCREKF